MIYRIAWERRTTAAAFAVYSAATAATHVHQLLLCPNADMELI